MQKSIWKLAALAGVVGIGCLVVLQAGRGLTRPDANGDKNEGRFEDFESAGPASDPSNAAEATSLRSVPADDSESDGTDETEIGFGQYEPAGGANVASRREDDATGNPFAANLEPDPFAPDGDEAENVPPTAKSATLAGGPRFPGAAGTSAPTAGGLDFRSGSDDSPRAVTPEKVNPFAASAPDESQGGLHAASGTSGNDASSRENPFAQTDVEEPVNSSRITPTGGPFELADDANNSGTPPVNGIRASSHNVEATAGDLFESTTSEMETAVQADPASGAEGKQTDNPFGDDGPDLLGSSTDAEDDENDSGTDLSTNPPDQGYRSLPVDDSSNDAPPFGKAPPSAIPATDAESDRPVNNEPPTEAEPFPSFERTPMPRSMAEPKSAKRLRPDPAAFEGNSTVSEPPVRLGTSDAADDPSSTPEPTTIEEKNTPQFPEADRPETLPDPISDEPDRISPKPKAVRLVPPTEDDLSGDATIDESAPIGPKRPQLSIVKQAPRQARLGEPLIYSIVVQNLGGSPAHQVIVEDRIPKRTRLTGTIPQAEMFEKKLIWKLGTLKPKEERKIQVRVVPVEEGQIGSIATVNFVAEVASRTLITAPSLKLELTGPQQTEVGRRVTFRFKVINDGTSDATGVVIRNLMPPELKHSGGNDLEYEVGTLPAGKSREVSLTVSAVQAGSVLNKAVVTADGDLSADAAARLRIDEAALEITRTGPERHFLGRSATFLIRVTNKAKQPIGPLTIVEKVPTGLEFISASDGGQYNAVQRTVAWRIDRMLVPTESHEVSLALSAKAIGVHSGMVTASGPGGRRAAIESRSKVVGLAALSANVDGLGGPVAVGESVSLKLSISNRGNAAAKGVRLRVELPDQLTLAGSEGPAKATVNGSEISFEPLPSVAARGETTLTVVLKAVRAGDARLKVLLDADHMSRPIAREEAIVIFADGR